MKTNKIKLKIKLMVASMAILGAASVALTVSAATLQVFTQSLKLGSKGNQVILLQKFLSLDPQIYPQALVTGYYGKLTAKAVSNFQTKYAAEILIPAGVTSPTSTVGLYTRLQLNKVYSSSSGIY